MVATVRKLFDGTRNPVAATALVVADVYDVLLALEGDSDASEEAQRLVRRKPTKAEWQRIVDGEKGVVATGKRFAKFIEREVYIPCTQYECLDVHGQPHEIKPGADESVTVTFEWPEDGSQGQFAKFSMLCDNKRGLHKWERREPINLKLDT